MNTFLTGGILVGANAGALFCSSWAAGQWRARASRQARPTKLGPRRDDRSFPASQEVW